MNPSGIPRGGGDARLAIELRVPLFGSQVSLTHRLPIVRVYQLEQLLSVGHDFRRGNTSKSFDSVANEQEPRFHGGAGFYGAESRPTGQTV